MNARRKHLFRAVALVAALSAPIAAHGSPRFDGAGSRDMAIRRGDGQLPSIYQGDWSVTIDTAGSQSCSEVTYTVEHAPSHFNWIAALGPGGVPSQATTTTKLTYRSTEGGRRTRVVNEATRADADDASASLAPSTNGVEVYRYRYTRSWRLPWDASFDPDLTCTISVRVRPDEGSFHDGYDRDPSNDRDSVQGITRGG